MAKNNRPSGFVVSIEAPAPVNTFRPTSRAYGFLWSNVPPAIRSREMMNLEAQVAQAQIPVIARVFQRSAFAAMFSFATTLDQLPPSEVAGIDKAKSDAIRLTDAIDLMIKARPATTTHHEAAA